MKNWKVELVLVWYMNIALFLNRSYTRLNPKQSYSLNCTV